MLSQDNLKIVKETLEEFFEKTTFAIEVDFSVEDSILVIKLQTDEPQILIGERGQTLIEIQQILKAILRRKITEPFFIDLDINSYKSKKEEYLKEVAKTSADDVALTREEKILPPMSAYERRIVHMELAERTDVITESIGEEPERKIIIKPRP